MWNNLISDLTGNGIMSNEEVVEEGAIDLTAMALYFVGVVGLGMATCVPMIHWFFVWLIKEKISWGR